MTSFAFAEGNPLKPFLWDYRVILVSASPDGVEDRVAELVRAQASIDDRHILWFVIDGESVATNHEQPLAKGFQPAVLKRFFAVQNGDKTQVRLIGKDGGVKAKVEELNLEKLFELIDSMPMRQAEMRKG
jgi:hypothetical protein